MQELENVKEQINASKQAQVDMLKPLYEAV